MAACACLTVLLPTFEMFGVREGMPAPVGGSFGCLDSHSSFDFSPRARDLPSRSSFSRHRSWPMLCIRLVERVVMIKAWCAPGPGASTPTRAMVIASLTRAGVVRRTPSGLLRNSEEVFGST